MKDNKSIRKILFISNSNIAIVVFDQNQGKNVVLFASQVKLNSADLKVKINDLLTNAANFLGFNIKDIEIVFDDPYVINTAYSQTFYDVTNEEEITKSIYKLAKHINHYVNEIIFNEIIYDESEKKASVNFELITSVYTTYKKFVNAAKECNLNVLNSTNIYTLLNNRTASSQIIIKIIGDYATVSEYALSKLNKVTKFDMQLNQIYINLSSQFNTTVENIKQMIKITNNIEADCETDTLVSLSYDLSHRKFNGIKAKEIVYAYQIEINKILEQNKFNLFGYSEVTIISNQSINRLSNAKTQKVDNIIGLENIDQDKLTALSNIDLNAKTNSHFKFETTLNGKINSLTA